MLVAVVLPCRGTRLAGFKKPFPEFWNPAGETVESSDSNPHLARDPLPAKPCARSAACLTSSPEPKSRRTSLLHWLLASHQVPSQRER
jgi:hypothetical protein